MRELIISLSIVLIIAACKDNPVEPEVPEESPYPAIVGAWQVTSPDHANWIGIQEESTGFSVLSDTITITEPGELSLSISADTVNESTESLGRFVISFVDSTINVDTLSKYDLDVEKVKFPNGDTEQSLGSGGYHRSTNDERMKVTYSFGHICKYPISNAEKALFEISSGDSLYQSYEFVTSGSEQTIKHIACGDSL